MCERPMRRPDVNWVELDGDVVVADPSSSRIHVLHGAAAAAWQLIDGAPIHGLDELIAETFGLAVADVARDLADALDLLAEERLVVPAGDVAHRLR